MNYNTLDFRVTPVEEVIKFAADVLYQAAHRERALARVALAGTVPASLTQTEHEDAVADKARDALLLCEEDYKILYDCERQLLNNSSWASYAAMGGGRDWTTKGKATAAAIKRFQIAYSDLQNAAGAVPGSVDPNRAEHLEVLSKFAHSVELRMVTELRQLQTL
ncbi:hypothetical protein D7U98_05615 [Stenotrophomonas maltophilia]|uniref:hypothetical protein n=1 Tax=Stenotrophomonas maltophilia TaxID=40324 RepID=UPI0013118A0C|nr:hypothetical protein [Stenotrophomonas maltophilia]MBA0394881.1 hypothetical protein [Stenotrophomonas maltophilia]